MLIHVTQKHVDAGKANDCWRCPVALALSDVLMEPWKPIVSGWGVTFVDTVLVVSREVKEFPLELHCFIDNFDDGIPVEPFSFEIHGMDHYFKRDYVSRSDT